MLFTFLFPYSSLPLFWTLFYFFISPLRRLLLFFSSAFLTYYYTFSIYSNKNLGTRENVEGPEMPKRFPLRKRETYLFRDRIRREQIGMPNATATWRSRGWMRVRESRKRIQLMVYRYSTFTLCMLVVFATYKRGVHTRWLTERRIFS